TLFRSLAYLIVLERDAFSILLAPWVGAAGAGDEVGYPGAARRRDHGLRPPLDEYRRAPPLWLDAGHRGLHPGHQLVAACGHADGRGDPADIAVHIVQ